MVKEDTHVHDWCIRISNGPGKMVVREWRCLAPGCRTRPIRQVVKAGSPYPDLPETEEVKP